MFHTRHATHRTGGTLDLVITKFEQDIIDIQVQPPNAVSDHSVITWSVDFPHHPPISVQRDVRSWAQLDRDKFRTAVRTQNFTGLRD